MAKRYNARAIRKHHSYTVEEAAEALGAHPQTVRAWISMGLPVLASSRPHLILGAHLREFLDKRQTARRRPLGPDELYCLRCRAAKSPAGGMADFVADGAGPGRLTGICPDCDRICHRFAHAERLAVIAPNLAIMRRAGAPDLNEPDKAA